MFWAARALHCCVHWAFLKQALADRPGESVKPQRDGDRLLQLLIFNEEFLVNAGHQLALTTSPPFVHTARRYYRLNDLVSCADCVWLARVRCKEAPQTWPFRGSKSRNKVSVGEPAEGSLVVGGCSVGSICWKTKSHFYLWYFFGCYVVWGNFLHYYHLFNHLLLYFRIYKIWKEPRTQFLATDVLAPATMKNAAKCDT